MRFRDRSRPTRRHRPVRIADLARTAFSSLAGARSRTVLGGLGVAVGAAAITTTASLTTTIRHQVSADFDLLQATQVVVEPVAGVGPAATTAGPAPAAPAMDRVLDLSGVERAGFVRQSLDEMPVGRSGLAAWTSGRPTSARAYSLDAAAIAAVEANVVGVDWRESPMLASTRTALLGRDLADQLDIDPDDLPVVVTLAGLPYSVTGVVANAPRLAPLTAAIVVPPPQSYMTFDTERDRLLAVVEPGAAQSVASAIPLALEPANPDRWRAYAPQPDEQFRQTVEGQLESFGYLLAGVIVVLGMFGIANATLARVLQQVGEIGLRRALGAQRWHIFVQIALESAISGLSGAALGALVGAAIAVFVGAIRDWLPLVPFDIVAATVLGGGVAGVVSGLYPARVASRIEPTEALRRGA